MKYFKYYIIIINIIIALTGFAQQEPQYTQYMFNQMILNPAYAGSKELLSASIFHRNQWNKIEGAPTTQSLSVHNTTKKNKVGWGASYVHDKIGPKRSNTLLGSYSYRIKLLNGKLSFGLRAGITNYIFNWDKVTHKDAGDPLYNRVVSKKTVPTADFGMYYYSNSLYAGFSTINLFPVDVSKVPSYDIASTLARHYYFTLGKAWAFSDNFVFNPSIMLKSAKGSPSTLDVNFSALLKQRLWLGLSLRSSSSVCVYTQILISDKYKIGLSFDNNSLNQLGVNTRTIELMLAYDLNLFKSKIISPRYL